MEPTTLLLTIAVPILTLGISAIFGYKAVSQKAEDHDLQLLRTTVDLRVAAFQREVDGLTRDLAAVKPELALCVRERIAWQEEKNRLLTRLIDAQHTRHSRAWEPIDDPAPDG